MSQKVSLIKVVQGEELSFTLSLKDQNGDPINLTSAALKVQFAKSDDTVISRSNTAQTFVDGDVTLTSDNIALADHGLVTNDVVQLTTTGTLPTGLATSTNYYVIVVDKDTIQLAASRDGSAINISAASGGGTHSVSAIGLAIAGDALLGKMTVTLSEDATAALKPAELQTIEIEKITSGVKRIVQLKRALSVFEQSYA